MIHSVNGTFPQNMHYSCNLYLIFSMLNRFLKNSWCLLLQVAGFVDNLQVYHLPPKGLLLSHQFKWSNNDPLNFRATYVLQSTFTDITKLISFDHYMNSV